MPDNYDLQFKEAIEGFFAEFHPQTRRLITDALLKTGELGSLLRKIGAPDPETSDDQYLTLLNSIRRMGEKRFREVVGGTAGNSHTEPSRSAAKTPPPGEERRAPMAQRRPVDQGPVRMRRVIAPLPERRIRPVDPDSETQELAGSRAESRADNSDSRPASSPAKILPVEPEPAKPGNLSRDPKPSSEEKRSAPKSDREAGAHLDDWDGVERRVSGERRLHKDRRNNVELIFKNKRYGRDRRSGEERRKNWPPSKDD